MNRVDFQNSRPMRYAMLAPLALLLASLITSCFSYSSARQSLANDLNEAMIALAHENSELWTRQDTIAALRQMREATHKPAIYQASDVDFRNASLREEAYFTLALVDRNNAAPKIHGSKIASDSIMLVPEKAADGVAIQVQGFADCSMASVFAASDQTAPGILFTLSLLSMGAMLALRKKADQESAAPAPASPTLNQLKLTPMQRRFTQMLLEAPGMKVDKARLCAELWDNKSNAEESLYTLVRRTKAALADTNIKIACNRGESYSLSISD
ncbi:MAG: helix-turn-helix domain-containing protein [Clostridium sp.]|nr:helix-turn-helix domain-containing protein [Clostridium sp.]